MSKVSQFGKFVVDKRTDLLTPYTRQDHTWVLINQHGNAYQDSKDTNVNVVTANVMSTGKVVSADESNSVPMQETP